VEGDLGIRFNAGTLVERVGIEHFENEFRIAFPQFDVRRGQISEYVDLISRETSQVPQVEWHCAVDAQLARIAVDIGIERHVGKKERIVTHVGEAWLYYGKDLTETRTVIGTGGVFIYNPHAGHILSAGTNGNDRYAVLRPKQPNLFVDHSYLLYAVGLLSQKRPDVGLRLFKNTMRPLRADASIALHREHGTEPCCDSEH
jgi:uncharacterized protein (TIGR01319 family)